MSELGFPPEAIPAFQSARTHRAAQLLRGRPRSFSDLAEVLGPANAQEALHLLRRAGILEETPVKGTYGLARSVEVPLCPLPSGRSLLLARHVQANPGKTFEEIQALVPGTLQRDPAITKFFLQQFGQGDLISIMTTETGIRIFPTPRLTTLLQLINQRENAP